MHNIGQIKECVGCISGSPILRFTNSNPGSRIGSLAWTRERLLTPIKPAMRRLLDTGPASALFARSYDRLSVIITYAVDYQNVVPKLLPQDIEALTAIDSAHQFNSDENIMATFKSRSSRPLNHQSIISHKNNLKNVEECSVFSNPVDADKGLALSGHSQAITYLGRPKNQQPGPVLIQWIRMLRAAGSELSVSICIVKVGRGLTVCLGSSYQIGWLFLFARLLQCTA